MRASVAFILVWLIFDRTANALGSVRGEYGLVVCAIVLILLALIQLALFERARTLRHVLASRGLRRSRVQPTAAAVVLVLALLSFFRCTRG
jgi:hypothetical protein